MHSVVQAVTDRIIARSKQSRSTYLTALNDAKAKGVHRSALSCGNLAHGFAACQPADKDSLRQLTKANIGIVTAFNDMLSAHQPYETYPNMLKQACMDVGSVAQVAAGVPAMCDGVTQGQPGMELSLLSREVIAMSTAIGLSHNMFDGALLLGICDKIVPGLLIGALSFGHLPMLFVPAGPMKSGIPNKEKARIRQQFAQGQVDRAALLEAEAKSYHSAGTCTFYGTANSNQLMLEIMGLQLPGSSFVNPDDPLRDELSKMAAKQVCRLTSMGTQYTPIGEIVSEKSVVNGIVGILATGGSTNLTMHIVAAARAAGIIVNWDDFSDLSDAVPLLARVYPNGHADINHFHAAGGMALLIKELLDGGLLHEDVNTVAGQGLRRYTQEPRLLDGQLKWVDGVTESLDKEVLTHLDTPFQQNGGLKLLKGNLGRAVIKVSAVPDKNRVVEGPAIVIDDQNKLDALFQAGELDRDCVVVVRGQGPKANGMPELHKLTPYLGTLQDKGFKVALVTDGRMSGASGKVPAAIHLTPEALDGGLIAKVENGDLIRVDASTGELTLFVDEKTLASRTAGVVDLHHSSYGMGRELFGALRSSLSSPETGARSTHALDELY
ncbi:phosphogluconate dehydratase [Shewanella sp. SR43-4]|jgi:phosphogluconate dehydratase|uniref:Phosphogluconate dehydratase n=1 Tax=Shewanella vesiculosa TaxID=518738 RepID=A0ABV0FMK0_9GAMM|nr:MULTISPECIES: phosphogluconate dehydratase [Shewanella]NCQ43841.1 phosphogluconate dehydratase [Shewanella frigidimarina]MBB1317052.1 phosphogluconate dehydratase [Shewanella sp. SR43-4]MBB1390581.1 phosphogluconate dehydratase [Shewanella sp. SG44-6]MBB1476492.1 phosphogluconate dehydratase [Shewanella sp. SG41-3]NCO70215.1 phosphogluconate dehydratase [Shewanella vesiculosa]|tara:strand:+ start:6792 stop:8618 length:1827 start_codon:yes stop_codon:yes gene_type:complete